MLSKASQIGQSHCSEPWVLIPALPKQVFQ